MISELISTHSSALVSGLLTLLGTVAGASIVAMNNFIMKNKEIESKNKRASVDYILQKEADVLLDLLDTGERAYHISREYASESKDGDISDELEKDANDALNNFAKSVRMSKAFLNDKEIEQVNALLGSTRSLIFESDPNAVIDDDTSPNKTVWRESKNNFTDFTDTLQKLLKYRIEEIRSQE